MLIKESDIISNECYYIVKIFFDEINIIDLLLDENYESITSLYPASFKDIYYVFLYYTKNKQKEMIEEAYFKDEDNLCVSDNFIYISVDILKTKDFLKKPKIKNMLQRDIKIVEFIRYFIGEDKPKLIDQIKKSKSFSEFQKRKLIEDINMLK